MTDRVAAFLDDIRLRDPVRCVWVNTLREMILGLSPDITETVKYGGILFSAGTPFCGIFAYSRHVSLEFSAGASLPDPRNILEGEGKFRRHVKLTSAADLSEKQIRQYVLEALATSHGRSRTRSAPQ